MNCNVDYSVCWCKVPKDMPSYWCNLRTGWARASDAADHRAVRVPLPHDGAHDDLTQGQETIPHTEQLRWCWSLVGKWEDDPW